MKWGSPLRQLLLVLIASTALLANGLHIAHAGGTVPHHHAGDGHAAVAPDSAETHDHAGAQPDSTRACCALACAGMVLPSVTDCRAPNGLSDTVPEFDRLAVHQSAPPPVRPPRPSV